MGARVIELWNHSGIKGFMVRFLELEVEEYERRTILEAINNVLVHGKIVLGPEVAEFEERLAKECGRKYSCGVSSGSDGLVMALKTLDIGPGDQVITTPLSWIATAHAICAVGATPVFADIDETLNLSAEAVANAISDKTRAILTVDFGGKLCDYDSLEGIAQECQIPIIEDASQAMGASLHGRPAGSFGRISAMSHNCMKVLACVGESGSVLTNSEADLRKLKILRYAGTTDRQNSKVVSLNHRMDTIHAATLLARLETFRDRVVQKRSEIANYYDNNLTKRVKPIETARGECKSHYNYTILTDERDELMNHLLDSGIECKVHHTTLMPEQESIQDYGCIHSGFPKAKKLKSQFLSIPVHEKLRQDEVELVTNTINDYFGH